MAPTKPGKYEFSPESLVEIRGRLGISQTKMASLLGIPQNTLSRWETKATTPDAESLAAIYSVATEQGITPSFFKKRRPATKQSQKPSRLLVMWDFQNLGVSPPDVGGLNAQVRKELRKRFPATSYQRYKAFSHPAQSAATDELQKLGWKIWEGDVDMDEEIINQGRSDCGQEPKDTVLVLITKDRDFSDLVEDLKAKGVLVYLIAPSSDYSQKLVRTVGDQRWIRLTASYAYAGYKFPKLWHG